jgi:hypothetical protein
LSIIIENQLVKAGVAVQSGSLEIDFADEPAFVLSESVVVDLMQRSIGVIYQNTYHHIGDLPASVDGKQVERMTGASLSGQGAGNKEIRLYAPIKIARA